MARPVGFLGLGMMGTPMSRNLLKAGFPLTVWNRTAARMAPLVAEGAHGARSPREVAERTQVIITMLSGPPEVEQVVLGPGGVLEGLAAGATLIDMSTNAPEVSRRLAEEVAHRGASMLDAPVSGSVGVATAAALTIQVGGEASVLEANRDVLQALGKTIVHVGGHGLGCAMKLVGNAVMGANMAVVAEAMCLGAKAGIPSPVMVEVLKATGAASAVLERRHPNVLKGDFTPQFMLKLLFKDLGLALDAAAGSAVPMPVAGLVRQLYAEALAAGRGDQDFSAIAAMAESLARVSLKAPTA